jgi:hypothetical protein
MRHREGLHWTPCSTSSDGVVGLLLIGGVIAAVVFWPTVVAVAATVALIVKVTLIVLAVLAVLGVAVAIAIAVRGRSTTSSVAVTAIEPNRIEDQLAALTAAVQRLERDRQPVLTAPAQPVALDPQALALLLTQLTGLEVAGQSPRVLPEGRDAR